MPRPVGVHAVAKIHFQKKDTIFKEHNYILVWDTVVVLVDVVVVTLVVTENNEIMNL